MVFVSWFMKKKARIGTVAMTCLVAMLTALYSPTTAFATSRTSAQGVSWANARASEGWNVDYDGAYGVQCVDLILAYYDYLEGWHTSGNAIDYASNTLPSGWKRVSSPQAGDVVVWNAGAQLSNSSTGGNEWADSTYGHIGIVTAVNSGSISTVETNTYTSRPAARHTRITSGVRCYIRPNWTGGTITVTQWPVWVENTTNTNTVLHSQVTMNQTVQFTQCGVKVWDPDDVLIINHTEGTTVNLNYMNIWYDVNGELGVTLKKGATYRFQFWCTGGGQTFYSDNSYFTTTGNYTVTFNANGHGSAPSAQSLKYNATVTRPSDLTASGYTFGGWYTNASCTNAYNFSRKVTSDFTLYAKWTKNYTVTFNANGHGTAPASQSIAPGATATMPADPTAADYSFDGWYTDQACTIAYNFSSVVTSDLTLYAKWTKDVVDISSAKVTLPFTLTPCTGKPITPSPTVTLDGVALVEGTDYEVSYANNVNVGTATVTVTGVGSYEGAATATFRIARAADGWVDLAGGGKGYGRGGRLVTGWMDLDGAKYWFDDQGRMATGWTDLVVDGKEMHYYFRPSGNLARGAWADIDGAKYYFRPSGNMATGWADIDGKKYFFDEGGQMVTGWRDVVNDAGVTNHYYFRPSGSMATGWAEIDGEHFYFRPSGNMATGFTDVTDDAYKRYFDPEGRMLTGWQVINGNTYYFRASGAMQTGEAVIDGMVFTFNDKGVLVDDEAFASAAEVAEIEFEEMSLEAEEEFDAEYVEAESDESLPADDDADAIPENASEVSVSDEGETAIEIVNVDGEDALEALEAQEEAA